LLSCECIRSLDLFFTITYSPHHCIAQPLSTRKLRCETAREASFEATSQVNLLDASISCFVTGVRASLVHTGTFCQDLLTFLCPMVDENQRKILSALSRRATDLLRDPFETAFPLHKKLLFGCRSFLGFEWFSLSWLKQNKDNQLCMYPPKTLIEGMPYLVLVTRQLQFCAMSIN